jgi:DNA-binding transcriptional ArsR family regulator
MLSSRMPVLLLALATFSILTTMPKSNAEPASGLQFGLVSLSTLTTKVVLDSGGSVHIIWTVHPSNVTTATPGIWYARYAPNGTNSIPPKIIRNATDIQSADLVVGSDGQAHIVWAEGPAFQNSTLNLFNTNSDAQIYYAAINSTDNNITNFGSLTGLGKIGMWPSISIDKQSIPHIVWTEETINSKNRTLSEYCATITNHHLEHPILVAEYYNQSFVTAPQLQMAYDRTSSNIDIAWVYSQRGQVSGIESHVNFARVNATSGQVNRIGIAEQPQLLLDAEVADGQNGTAFVVWQSPETDSLATVYVSKISNDGRVLFLKSFKRSYSSTSYLTASSDTAENLYLVWYYPPILPKSTVPVRAESTVSYMKIDEAGSVTDSGNQLIPGTVLAIGISGNEGLYAVSSSGLVQVRRPPLLPIAQVVIGLGALCGAGVAVTEEGRYRILVALRTPAKMLPNQLLPHQDNVLIGMLNERPGIRLGEIRDSSRDELGSVNLRNLVRLERGGYVSSIRVGLGRRFFGSAPLEAACDYQSSVATRILNSIKDAPGIWEGKLAQDLGLSQQIVHYHLKRLRSARLLSVQVHQRRKLYRLANSTR